MQKKFLLVVPILLVIVVVIYNCDKRGNFSHLLPSNHPLIKLQNRFNEIVNYTRASVVKITGDKEIPTFFYGSQSDFRDWVIGTGFVFKKDNE